MGRKRKSINEIKIRKTIYLKKNIFDELKKREINVTDLVNQLLEKYLKSRKMSEKGEQK